MNFENEINYAKHLENIDFSKDENYFSKCVMLVRYWRTEGKNEKSIFDEIYKRLKSVYFDFGDNMIFVETNNILKIASTKGLLQKKVIKFSKEELDFIHSFNQLNFEKMLFIMFCAYKIEESGRFTIKMSELMKFSKNGYSKKYCTSLLSKAYKNNIFNMDSFHNVLKYYPTEETLDLFNPNNIVLEIENFKNLVYYYLEYISSGRYIRCKKCGCIEKKKSNNQEYCIECANENQLLYNREYMRRIRKNVE